MSDRVYSISDDNRRRFGEKIRRARDAKGYSQGYTAESSGVSLPYYKKIEAGKVEPSVFMVSNIARTLGTSMEGFTDHIETPMRRTERLWAQYKGPERSLNIDTPTKRKILTARGLW